jgi:hypothetical protein
MANEINQEVLKDTFAQADFVIKELDIGEDGICRIEWNYPDEPRGIALRTAYAKNGADVSTYYRYSAISEARGELMSRDRALVPFSSAGDLREFFNKVLDDYMRLFDAIGLNPQGTNKQASSYHPAPGRVRRPLSAQ